MAELTILKINADYFSAWFNSESALASFSVSSFASNVSSSGGISYSSAVNSWELNSTSVIYSDGDKFIKWGGEFVYKGDSIVGGHVTSFERSWGESSPTGHIFIDKFCYHVIHF